MIHSSDARRWLRFQLILGGVGAVTWYSGALTGADFVAGIGVGILVSALALRLLRRRT